ncbi:hypothetical protein IKO70_10740 [bacterium]|nr:hypothetical protein [bacterium]
MITIEKVLRFVSASTLAATIIFTVVVVVKELTKPKDILERIKKEHCASVSELEEAPSFEYTHAMKYSESECVFVPSSLRGKTNFTSALFNFRRLDAFDYLFAGKSGILLKKNDDSLEKEADFIIKCFRNEKCPDSVPDKKRTVTATAWDVNGNLMMSVTYEDDLISATAKNLKKLFNEIAKIKKLDLTKLRLVLYFHSEYAYLEDKSDKYLISLPKSGVDGLYLKSRGAKIRLLPWEYSTNPLSVLDRKGSQYGLDKNEYQKDVASVYFYRTTQFSENDGNAEPWFDGSSLQKNDYSPKFSLHLISKHLKNIQREDGSFPTELETSDAKEKNAKESLLMQAYAAEVLFRMAEYLEDPALAEAAEKALKYVLEKEEKDDAATAKLEALMLKQKKEIGYQYQFFDFDRTEKAITANFIYSGIFIEAFSLLSKDKNKDEKIVELLKKAISLFESASTENKMRFIGYLADFNPEKESASYKAMEDFFASQTAFLKEMTFDDRDFWYEEGTFTTDKSKNFPDTSLSLLLADGLMKAFNNGLIDSETGLRSSDFIRKLIVSSDDFPNWGSVKAKARIQGGVRASNRSKSVKLSNTLRAASYFINIEDDCGVK